MARNIEVQIQQRVLTLSLRGITPANPMSRAMNLEIQDVCRRVMLDHEVDAMVITGGPSRSFCAGGDFNEVSAMSTDEEVDAWIDRTLELYVAVLKVDKPIIAAVDGFAIGIGFQLALACDLRLATATAKFIMWELKHGIACTIGAFMLEQFLGRAAMLHLTLGCEPLSVDDGLATRIIHSIVEPEALLSHAQALARKIADYPELPRRRTKETVNKKLIAGLLGIAKESRAVHREAFAARTAERHFARVLGR